MKKYLFIFILFLSLTKLHSPPFIVNCKEIDNITKSTLFVVMDMQYDVNQDYADIFEKYWKLCPVKFIGYNNISENISEKSYFMSSATFISYIIQCQLILWKPSKSLIKKANKKGVKVEDIELNSNAIIVAGINLSYDSQRRSQKNAFSEDFMGKEELYTSGNGILRNYLQYIQYCIKNEIFNRKFKFYTNPKELANLRKSTLYIPERIINYNNQKINEDSAINSKKTLDEIENYSFKFEFISMEKLNELILTSEEPIYYLLSYVDYEMFYRAVYTVTNSLSGEIIFHDDVVTSDIKHYSPRLFKILKKEIEKN